MSLTGPFDALGDLGIDDLRQRLQTIRDLIERAPVPIAIAHDPDCRVVSANRALAALLGVEPDANVSLNPTAGELPYRIQRNGRDLPPAELPMQSAIAHRCPVSNEIEILRRDGVVLYIQNDVEPLYDSRGAIYGCVSVCVDITARKLAEMTLRDADRRKDEFLATLSHELRNPLAPIRAALEIMRLARGDMHLVEQARATMERQLAHLVRITDDLLDVSRITQNKIELRRERLDLRAVLQSAIESARPLIDALGHALVLDVPPGALWIDGDFTRLAQTFSNLLNNAAKYTDRGGDIRISAVAGDREVTIAVSDTGVGIPASMLPRIFDMFTQLQPHRDRTQGGLGIGLTLARRLIELHGGRIEARSEGPGTGSTFIVRLPLARPAEAGAAAVERRGAAARAPCRILVAEDNADAADMMRVMLELKGHEVQVAADGVEAVELAAVFVPAIAFIDIGMPRMDGYEAARRIRERLGPGVRLVALTGWGQEEDQLRSRESGFDYHLTKPPDLDLVDRLIADCSAK